jgi:hypothetical protein
MAVDGVAAVVACEGDPEAAAFFAAALAVGVRALPAIEVGDGFDFTDFGSPAIFPEFPPAPEFAALAGGRESLS